MAAPVILVEGHPRRAADGATVIVRLAGAGGARPYYHGGKHWRAGLSGLPRTVAKLDFDGEQLGGGGVSQALEIAWAPGSRDALDELSGLIWNDAPISVRIGPEDAGLPPISTSGLGLDASVQDGTLHVALADSAVDLKRPVLTDRYAGTGGIEGPIEWKDQIKPRVWGRCFNVLGRLIDEAAHIWVFGDPRRPIHSFRSVRTRGVEGSPLPVLPWQGSVDDTLAALRGTPAPEGGGILCPSLNAVKWWTTVSGDLRADLWGETEGGYVETAPEIAARIVAARSTLTFAPGEIAAAVSVRPAPIGWRVDSDSATASEQLSSMLADVSLSWFVVDGGIVLRPWDWTGPTRSARSHSVSRRSVLKPVTTRKLGYHHNQAPMQRSDIAAAVLASDVVYRDGTNAEVMKPLEPGATKGAPAGTPVGDRLAEQINQDIDDLRTAIENGDAGSSAEAIEAARNAAAARDAAQGARNEAQGFRDQTQSLVDNFDPTLDQGQIDTITHEVKAETALRPNLLAYGSFENGLLGWNGDTGGLYAYDNATLGPILNGVPAVNDGVVYSNSFPVDPTAVLTISADIQLYAGTGSFAYVDLFFSNAAGQPVLDGPQRAVGPGTFYRDDGTNQDSTNVSCTVPGNATQATARFVWHYVPMAGGNMGVRRIKVEQGTRWSWYTQEKTAQLFNARITTTETAVTDGRFAAATRVSQLEAQTVGAGPTSLSSRINDNAVAATTATGAVADRASALEARGRSSLTLNSDFNSWPDGSPLPTGWGNWSNAHLIARSPGAANTGSRWCAVMNAPADANVGLQQGFFKPFGAFEMSVTVEAGEYRGSGMLVQWFTYNNGNPIYQGNSQISFATDKDTSGWVGIGGYRRTFVNQFTTPIDGAIDYFIIYAMANWEGFGQPRVAKSIRFIECSLSPASAGSVTSRDTVARLSNEETVRARDDGALSARQSITEAKFNGTQASWVSEQIAAQANATGAVADRATRLETSTRVGANLVPNSSFENGSRGWNGTVGLFSFYSNPAWGPVAYSNGRLTAADVYLDTDPVPIYGDNYYTASGSIEMHRDNLSTLGSQAYIGILWLDGNKGYITETRGAYRGGPISFASPLLDEMKVTAKSPTNAAFAVTRFGTNPLQDTWVGFRRMKLEFGTERTLYSAEGTSLSFNTRIGTVESAVTDGRFASATRASVLEAQMNGTVGSSLRTRIETVEQATTDGRFATASRASNLEAQMAGALDSNLRARISGLETVTTNGTFATAGRVDTLEVSIPKTGNLLSNSPLVTADGWTFASQGVGGLTATLNIAGDDWHPAGENVLSVYQAGGSSGQGIYWYSELVSVVPGKIYQAQFLVNTHRCNAELMVEHWDSPTVLSANGVDPAGQFRPSGASGRNLSSFTQAAKNFTARGNYMRLRIVKWGSRQEEGATDSYLWALHPQISQVTSLSSPLAAYLPSSDRATAARSLARLETVEALSATADGRTRSYWQKTAVAGNGRAQITLYATDGNNNPTAGVDIVGDVGIHGALVVDGSITTRGMAYGTSGQSSVWFNDNAATCNDPNNYVTPMLVDLAPQVGEPVRGGLSFVATCTAGARGRLACRIIRAVNGHPDVIIKAEKLYEASDWGSTVAIQWIDSVPANTYAVYSLQVRKADGNYNNINIDGFYAEVNEAPRNGYQHMTINTAAPDQGPGLGSAGGGTVGGNPDPGNTGHPGGGIGCPEVSELVLLANDALDGPGEQVPAGQLKYGQHVWTQHEDGFAWGAHRLMAVWIIPAALYEADGYPITSGSHEFYVDGVRTRMDAIGRPNGRHGQVVTLKVADAHTYVVAGRLSHNKSVDY